MPIPAYSSLIQYIPAYSSLLQPIPAFTQMPNLQPLISNLQFEMANCAFYPQLGILSVNSLKSPEIYEKDISNNDLSIVSSKKCD